MADASEGPRTSSEQPGGRPVLSEPQLAVLRRYGTEQRVAIGDVLFRDGDQTYDLIVLREGEVRITEHFTLSPTNSSSRPTGRANFWVRSVCSPVSAPI